MRRPEFDHLTVSTAAVSLSLLCVCAVYLATMEDSLELEICRAVLMTYEGDVDEQTGLYSGYGEATFNNGGCYEGDFHLGLFHGKGKYTWRESSVFEGDFVHGNINGKGQFNWSNGSKYEGDVKNGKRHGTGQYTSTDGQVYNGEWLNGKRHGKGKMYYTAEKSVLYVVCSLADSYP